MATLYITSTNATGSGTLYSLIKSASPGDVITPDPEIFGVGERVEITFESAVKFIVPVTIDAGKTRLIWRRRNSGLIIDNRDYYGFSDFDARGVAFLGRLLLSGDASTLLKCNFYNCIFGGFDYDYNSLHCTGNAKLTLYDCALICGKGSAFAANIAGAEYTFYRCTFAANKKNTSTDGRQGAVYVDCIDEPDLATAQFVNVPTSIDDVDVTKWEEYDFTPLPSSPYAAGAASAEGLSDLNGNRRGYLDDDGATQYALGAYEVKKADYFYSGEGDSFNDPAVWIADPTIGAAPETIAQGGFYIGANASFIDLPPVGSLVQVQGAKEVVLQNGGDVEKVVLGDGARMTFNSPSTLAYLAAGANSSIKIDAPAKTIVAITENAAFDGPFLAAAANRAYLAAPVDSDLSNVSYSNVYSTVYGAGASDFSAKRYRSRVELSWNSDDETLPVLVEKYLDDGTRGGALLTSASPVEFNVAEGTTTFSLCDGVNLYEQSVYWDGYPARQWSAFLETKITDPEPPTWAGLAMDTVYTTGSTIRPNQSVSVLARIYDSFHPDIVLLNAGDNIYSVTYTATRKIVRDFATTWTTIDGHSEVDAGAECVLPEVKISDAWKVDDVGYSFVLTPDVTSSPLFATAGDYRLAVTIKTADSNPVVLYYDFTVED